MVSPLEQFAAQRPDAGFEGVQWRFRRALLTSMGRMVLIWLVCGSSAAISGVLSEKYGFAVLVCCWNLLSDAGRCPVVACCGRCCVCFGRYFAVSHLLWCLVRSKECVKETHRWKGTVRPAVVSVPSFWR